MRSSACTSGAGRSRELGRSPALQITFENDIEIKKALLGRLAELSEGSLTDVPRAVAAYVERLELDPSDLVAMLALERLYEARSEWPALIGILQKRDAVALNEHEGRVLARRVGEVYETKLNDREHAIDAYTEVLSRFGNDRETVVALERVYEASEKYQDLLDTLQTRARAGERSAGPRRGPLPLGRVDAQAHQRARVGARRLSCRARRAARTRRHHRCAQRDGGSGGATRVDAARVLVPHYEVAGRSRAPDPWRSRWSPSPKTRASVSMLCAVRPRVPNVVWRTLDVRTP